MLLLLHMVYTPCVLMVQHVFLLSAEFQAGARAEALAQQRLGCRPVLLRASRYGRWTLSNDDTHLRPRHRRSFDATHCRGALNVRILRSRKKRKFLVQMAVHTLRGRRILPLHSAPGTPILLADGRRSCSYQQSPGCPNYGMGS